MKENYPLTPEQMAWMPWQNKVVAKTLRSHSVPNLQGLYNIPNNTGQSTGIHSLTHVKTWSYPKDLRFFLIEIIFKKKTKKKTRRQTQVLFIMIWGFFVLLFVWETFSKNNCSFSLWSIFLDCWFNFRYFPCFLRYQMNCLFFAIPAFSLVFWASKSGLMRLRSG